MEECESEKKRSPDEKTSRGEINVGVEMKTGTEKEGRKKHIKGEREGKRRLRREEGAC